MPVVHQSMYISNAFLLSFRYARVRYKDEVPDLSFYNKNIGTSCNFNLKERKN